MSTDDTRPDLSVPLDERAAFRAPTMDAAGSVSDDSGRDLPSAHGGSRGRAGAVAQAHPLDAAMEAVAVMEEAEATWSLAARGDRYRRALILSTALRAAGPAIVTEANLTAEAKLAAIEALCHECAEEVRADYPGVGMPAVPVSAGSILAIIGTGGEPS